MADETNIPVEIMTDLQQACVLLLKRIERVWKFQADLLKLTADSKKEAEYWRERCDKMEADRTKPPAPGQEVKP